MPKLNSEIKLIHVGRNIDQQLFVSKVNSSLIFAPFITFIYLLSLANIMTSQIDTILRNRLKSDDSF
jgi:hypothetical protein